MTTQPSSLKSLKESFQKLLPLVDDLADGLGILLLISISITIWIFIYCFQLQHFSLWLSISSAILCLMPILILSRIWFALENLKDIPSVAEEIIEDVSEDAAQSWHAVKSGKKGALNFFGQAKKLFEIRNILYSADNIFEQYFTIGPLVNPFYLFLSAVSLFGLFLVFIVGLLLVLFHFII